MKNRLIFQCAACGYQASLTAGTIFHKIRVELKKWLLAIYLLATTRKPVSSAELARQPGVASMTVRTMRRKIMHAMTRRKGELMLAGVVEMDESYVGGVRKGKRGRGSDGKMPVAVSEPISSGGF